MTDISKSFGAFKALDNVSLTAHAGTLHAIVGENGAGKTTLMRALYGALSPESGSIELGGKAQHFGSSRSAIQAGVGMMSQHPALIPDLNCLENLILGAEGGPFLKLGAVRARAEELASRLGFRFDWNLPAGRLSPAAAQRLEVLKLLWRGARIMILDEPTAMLSPADGEALFGTFRRLAEEGATVLFVTHHLGDVTRYCEEVTVLRAGRLIGAMPVAQTSAFELAEMIVGRKLEPPAAYYPTLGPPLLEISGLNAIGTPLRDAELTLREGELLGVIGVDGNGQRELLRAILGLQPQVTGNLRFAGRGLQHIPTGKRVQMGIRVIPEDRLAEGVVEDWNLEWNSVLGLHRLPQMVHGNLVRLGARSRAAQEIVERFGVKYSSLSMPVRSLSGGNQQRLVAGRALYPGAKLLLAFQPARGLDLLATREVYEGIRSACAAGAAAIVVGFDLDELLANCDRLMVMSRGVLRSPPPGVERNPIVIGQMMVEAG